MEWILLYKTSMYTEAAIVQGRLEENEIPVQVLNRQDTMYNVVLGEYEIYVPVHLKEVALGMLNESLHN